MDDKAFIYLKSFAIGHQKGNALLRQLNLSVNPGEMVALIGRNGAGKSTLLKSMIGLLAPLEGVCLLEGIDLDEYSLPRRAQKLSFVSYHLDYLPSLSVGELVALGRMPYTGWTGRLNSGDRARISQALEELQLIPLRERKLDCLSDGERQRAMIAGALVQDTPLMVLDEPTAFLDIPNTYEMIRLLSKIRDGGRSIVYSTHDLETAMQCADKMWLIQEDAILEGAPEDLGIWGMYEDLFSSSGIGFDEHTGRFLFKGNQRGRVCLLGEPGRAQIWTRSMLERLGYMIDPEAGLTIRVLSSGDHTEWILENSGQVTKHENLYALARFLKHV